MSRAVAIVETAADGLIYYEQAKIALEMARTADEVNHVMGAAEALRASARVANNREMETNAAEIRIRATRRLGEMLRAHKEQGGLKQGPRPINSEEESIMPTLEEIGVAPKMSMVAQNLAALPGDDFEDKVIYWRRKCEDGKSRVTVSLYTNGDAPGIPHRPDCRCLPPSSPQVSGDPDYHEEVWLYIERRKALGLSQAALDEVIGWGEGQTSKYELPHNITTGRIASGLAMSQWRRGLGLGLALVPLT